MDGIMAEDLEEDFEENEEGEVAAEEGGGKPDMKKIIMIVAPIILLIGVGAGLYFSGLLDGLLGKKHAAAEEAAAEEEPKKEEAAPKEEKKEEHGGGEEKKEKKKKKEGGGHEGGGAPLSVFMDLPDMLVNLQSTGRKQSFLKIHVALELDNPADQPKVDAVMPRIVDSFQVYLRELRTDDLQGAAGMHLLREELLSRVSLAVQPVKVKDILFREILIQ